MSNIIVSVKNVKSRLGGVEIHRGVDLTVEKGQILGIVGGSGSGKTTLLREMLGLLKPDSGTINILGKDIFNSNSTELLNIQKRWGVLFQQSALFSSLNLLENVSFPLKEHTDLDPATIRQLALLKIQMTGLAREAAYKFPSELSGGMQKRAGLARAIALDPELVFLDEPTSGLDPETASAFDELILNLRNTMELTIVMVTHDLDSLWRISDKVVFLGEGVVLAEKPIAELVKDTHPLIASFFSGPRGRAAMIT